MGCTEGVEQGAEELLVLSESFLQDLFEGRKVAIVDHQIGAEGKCFQAIEGVQLRPDQDEICFSSPIDGQLIDELTYRQKRGIRAAKNQRVVPCA